MKPLSQQRRLPLFLCVLVASLAAPVIAYGQYFEDFESYKADEPIGGLGGWERWDLVTDPAIDADVTTAYAYSGVNSLAIDTTTDIVQQFDGEFVSGRWALSMWVYVPGTMTGSGYLIVLNTYKTPAGGGAKNWSTQLRFDSATDTAVSDGGSGFTMPGSVDLVTDAWVKVYVDIDLDANTQTLFYDGKEVASGAWTFSGTRTIECIDLYGSTAAPEFYYDDIQIVPDCNGNTIDDGLDIDEGRSEDCNEDRIPDECQSAAVADALTLTASDAATEAAFGCAVAIDGDRLVVGARTDSEAATDAGAVYVFERSGEDWIQKQKLKASDAVASDEFGYSVAISGDVIVVGSRRDEDCCSNMGTAYVFRLDGTTWEEEQKLDAGTNASAGDEFGVAVAVDGDRIVVGAWLEDAVASNAGAAYVFQFASGEWEADGTLAPTELGSSDQFGRSVALDGDWLFVGAGPDDDLAANAGAVYVYHRTATAWELDVKLKASDGGSGDNFGNRVAVRDNVAVVGAYLADSPGADAGAAYVFRRNDEGVWEEEDILLADDAAADDGFGGAVAVLGDRIAIGASDDDAATGSVYTFICSGDTWSQQAKLTGPTITAGDELGVTVALGAATYAAGSELDDAAATDGGSVQMFSLRDCDDDGVLDACQIADDAGLDTNGDGVLDECVSGAMVCSGGGEPPPDDEILFKRGDANNNGVTDPLSDALRLLSWGFAGGLAPPCMCAADSDGNHVVSALNDAIRLLSWGFSGGAAPPAPGPTKCGPDPQEGALCDLTAPTTPAEACGTTTGHGRLCEP